MQNKTDFLKEQLKERGYKVTSQRRAVLDVLTEHEGEHLSPEEIYNLVRRNCPEIGLATVYRSLLLFETIDMVCKHDFDDGLSRYEINKNRDDHRHHHLICVKCGTVEEVKEDLLEALEEQISRQNGFIVKDHRVKFYGYCKNCSAAN